MIVWEFEHLNKDETVKSRALFSSKSKAEAAARQTLHTWEGLLCFQVLFDYIESTAAIKDANGTVYGWIVRRNVR
jgi:hypothetical protein